jgi:hypothetical protein
MNTIQPTVGRVVLVTVPGSQGPVVVPALVTAVHSLMCISVVALSATLHEGFHAGATRPMSSIEHNEDATKVGTWRWMEYQKGQAQKTDQIGSAILPRVEALEKALAAKADTQRITKQPKAVTKAKAKPRKRRSHVN